LSTKHPNIIFFLIDGLRADQCYGKDKTSVTPNLDGLIQKGVYFTNAYSSVDGTILSLKTIFHSLYPIKIGNRSKLTLQENNLFDILAKNNYEVNGLVPDLKGFSEYVNCFQNTETTYTYWFFCFHPT
jgi:arylsulfatase A-like enzyme